MGEEVLWVVHCCRSSLPQSQPAERLLHRHQSDDTHTHMYYPSLSPLVILIPTRINLWQENSTFLMNCSRLGTSADNRVVIVDGESECPPLRTTDGNARSIVLVPRYSIIGRFIILWRYRDEHILNLSRTLTFISLQTLHW